MFDAKKLLDQFLGSQIPGVGGSVRDRAGGAVQMVKDNPWKAGALATVLLGTKTGRSIAGNALTIGGLAAIAGLGYQAYKNYQAGQAPAAPAEPARQPSTPLVLPPPVDSGFGPQSPAGSNEFVLVLIRAMIHREGAGVSNRSRLADFGCEDRRAEGGALHRLAPDDRAGFACRARLSRSACRTSRSSRCARRSYRGDGVVGQGHAHAVMALPQ